jgi:starvation-inducible DNA-binding protein
MEQQTLASARNFNSLPNPAKRNSGETLIGLVADLTGLYQQVKTAHWNLRGAGFIGLHRLLDEVAAELLTLIDETAERVRQLGLIIDGNLATLALQSKLGLFPTGLVNAPVACTTLCTSMATVIESMRWATQGASGEFFDPVTADLLTKHSGTLETQLWLIESNVD